jgi:hypothetical protein
VEDVFPEKVRKIGLEVRRERRREERIEMEYIGSNLNEIEEKLGETPVDDSPFDYAVRDELREKIGDAKYSLL